MTAEKFPNSKIRDLFFFYIVPFTIAFLFLQFFIFYPFLKAGKSFVWYIDGISQHYPALKYYGEMLRSLLKGEGFKMIDFSLGMGFDTLTTLNYYVIGDPLTLLALFAKGDNVELLYKFLIILRLYLAGVSFLLYCNIMKKKGFQSVIGAMIYVFCGYSLYACVRHPYFINPMIYLPLLFIGLEKIFHKKSPYFFIVMTFISAISNFYFFYMLTILIFVYGVIRFFDLHKGQGKKEIFGVFLKTAGKTSLYYLLGIIMAGILFIPVVAAFLNNGRFSSGYTTNFFYYAKEYYGLMAYSFFAADTTQSFWTRLIFGSFTLISMYLIVCYRKNKALFAGFLISTISLLIPAIGYMMNGFSYVSNRWIFGYSLLIAFSFVCMYENMFHLKKRDGIILICAVIFYAVGCAFFPTVYGFFAVIFLALSVTAVLFFGRHEKYCRFKNVVIFGLVFLNLLINGYLIYDSSFGNYTKEFIDSSKVEETINSSAIKEIANIKDSSVYRIETYGDKYLNEALTNNYNDVSGYFSIMGEEITEYMKGLELINQKAAYRFDNLDHRTYISTLAGVKYMVTSKKTMAPYGYQIIDKDKEDKNTYYTLENKNFLSIGYTYKQYITREAYENLSALKKQEIMMQAVVLEKPLADFYSIDTDSLVKTKEEGGYFSEKKLDFTYQFSEGISLNGDTLKVTKEGAKIRLYFKGMENAETYVRFQNFNINDTDYYMMNFKVKGEGGITQYVNVRPKWHATYFGKENYLVNLGYKKEAMNYVDITFPLTGDFHLEGIEVYALPMDSYEEYVSERLEGSLEDVKMENNKITAKAKTETPSILCLAIPYSKGFQAYVNGNKQTLLKANVMYMAIPLKAGNNKIELYYETPYLKSGMAASGAGWFLFICLIVYRKYKG